VPALRDQTPLFADTRPAVTAPTLQALWLPCPTFTYLAGAAGSGKTFLTKDWARRDLGIELCATTGIAAINLGGTTINALLGFFDTKSLMENYTSGMLGAKLGRLWKAGIRRLVIDEVSMLDGDQLTYLVRAINEVNGRGYVLATVDDDEEEAPPPALGLTLVGDFAQLPPVRAPYAFESPEWRQSTDGSGDGGPRFAEATITLKEIRRQADPDFIEALRAARVGDGATAAAYFSATGRFHPTSDDRFEGPTLLAKNDAVDRYNWLRLDKIPGRPIIFPSQRWGKQRSEWGNPDRPPNTWGIPLRLSLKEGALVMVLANRRTEELRSLIYVNGDLGELVSANETNHTADVRLQRTGEVVQVQYVRRQVLQPCDAARRKELRAAGDDDRISEDGKWEITGWIDYMPLRVAYASTVHKSQGLSLDAVQINFRDAFFKSPGMVYVALSRARTAGGLRLVGNAATLIERCHADPRLQEWL
jgi:ATP-dependent DNA helicase PIF1